MRSFLLIYRFNGHRRIAFKKTLKSLLLWVKRSRLLFLFFSTEELKHLKMRTEQVETSGLETEATLHTYMDILFKLGFSTFCICVKDPESRLWQTDVWHNGLGADSCVHVISIWSISQRVCNNKCTYTRKHWKDFPRAWCQYNQYIYVTTSLTSQSGKHLRPHNSKATKSWQS